MKKNILFLLLITKICFGQIYKSAEINYNLISSLNLKKENTKKEDNKLEDIINSSINEKEFFLEINSKGFLFSEKQNIKDEKQKLISKLTDAIFLIYDFQLDKTTNKLYKIIDNIKIEHDNNYKWSVTEEFKKIDDYTCYKATCNIEYIGRSGNLNSKIVTAWYSPEINFNYGPNGFMGLPGLILEIEYGKTKLVAKEIKFFKEDIDIKYPTYKTITKEEFQKQINEN